MFHKKCAFCESAITHVSYGEIEHFKPKSSYPELCFNWENFLLSCSICNNVSNKGNKFPLQDEGGPLINPTQENPDDFFNFDYDGTLNKFIVIPKHPRSVTMLNIIKLNREDLLEHRTQVLVKIIKIIEDILESDPTRLNTFKQIFSVEDEYFAFIQTIFSKVESNLST